MHYWQKYDHSNDAVELLRATFFAVLFYADKVVLTVKFEAMNIRRKLLHIDVLN